MNNKYKPENNKNNQRKISTYSKLLKQLDKSGAGNGAMWLGGMADDENIDTCKDINGEQHINVKEEPDDESGYTQLKLDA